MYVYIFSQITNLPNLASMASLSFSTSVSSTCPFRRLSTNPTFPCSYKFPAIIESKIREIFMPALSSTMTEGKIVSWIKSEGDVLTKGESVVVVESDKADMDVETFYDGILAVIVVNDGETAPVGSPVALLAETQDEVSLAKAQALTHSSGGSAPSVPKRMTQVSTHGTRKIVATPNAKKLAKQYKVDIDKVNGTGPFGRITSEDVEKAAGIISPPAAAPPAGMPEKDAAPASLTLPEMLPSSGVVPFSTMQFDLSKKFEESLSVPTFRVAYPVVTDALNALYKKVKRQGVTMTALLAKAAAMALAQHPVVNAFCQDGKSFMYNSSINIAVFVEINGELIKLVLQDADKLDLYLLSQKWKELLDKARAKQLQPHEYNSGTFTLTNLGMFGVDRYDAILPPQGAIMAVGASKPTVVADADGFFSVKTKMLVNVTADHRIVYGTDLAAFLQTFSKIVENPESMTM